MLVLSVGIVKSGSAWFVGLTNDLLMAAGHPGSQYIIDTNNLNFVKWNSFSIQQMDEQKLNTLTSLPENESTFVVKTHSPSIPKVVELINSGQIFVTYIFRDPRDIVLAGLDAGKVLRSRGINERFGALTNFNEAVEWCHNKLKSSWDKWSELEKINLFKYEDLNNDTKGQLQRLSGLLNLGVSGKDILRIVTKNSSAEIRKKGSGKFHFNKGISYRFREEMTPEQLALCNKTFEKYILEMGYEF